MDWQPKTGNIVKIIPAAEKSFTKILRPGNWRSLVTPLINKIPFEGSIGEAAAPIIGCQARVLAQLTMEDIPNPKEEVRSNSWILIQLLDRPPNACLKILRADCCINMDPDNNY